MLCAYLLLLISYCYEFVLVVVDEDASVMFWFLLCIFCCFAKKVFWDKKKFRSEHLPLKQNTGNKYAIELRNYCCSTF